ncbi:MAG: aspartate-semialdehyde dehydrogenase [Bacteroidota bacterium]
MKIAIIGATGLVGRTMIKVLDERDFPVHELVPVASGRSEGKEIRYRGIGYKVIGLEEAVAQCPDIALFSAGSAVSLEWAPKFAEAGTTVIDNSSAWRMDPGIKLIVPEINATLLSSKDKIIANPNCSTIQMVMVMAPLHEKYKIRRIVVSTYQSVTGTGMKAVKQLENERKGNLEIRNPEMAYPYPIDKNCLPHCDGFTESGYTKEEIKLINETQKILNDHSIGITATAVRVPVIRGHSEAVNVEFGNDYNIKEARSILSATKGVVVQDDILNNQYPMPIFAEGKDEVFVGRLRRDESKPNTLNLWIVADNLRKGAATNAVQIAEYLVENKLV